MQNGISVEAVRLHTYRLKKEGVNLNLQPFREIKEVSKIEVDDNNIHVFIHMPRYSRELLLRLIDAEYKMDPWCKFSFWFYPELEVVEL